ncbi:hypothetical protein N7492_000568 [Penicillium capsulatum]|uniref:Mitochondrial thiamine pyrophosphate carrier 1 n=1 Tax=Penicillium capsulatum TaxID=69766 RepID=A0A9W9IS45_9EURO|nr:hypothetical protein N7492_000568 [Penicillium capsulatum]KAJ6130374.1 hypothetical protein N7512_003154 [Penicillium capsulatum]
MDVKSSITASTRKQPVSSKPADVDYPRWFGGSASCMAVMVSQPFDLVKVRMQTVSTGVKEGSLRTGLRIIQTDALRGLYHGLSAGLMRSLTYGTTRIALYDELKKSTAPSEKPHNPPMLATMAAASGFVGAIFGTPSDIANIRMQNDRSLPVHERRNYRNVFDAWAQMKRSEGMKSFTQGLWPNCVRCAVMTGGQLASYDVFKNIIQRMSGLSRESSWVHLSASLMSSLTATTLCSPMDVVRTQLMSSSANVSLLDIVRSLFRAEGYRWVFRGWVPSFMRLGPQTMATLVFLEQHRRIYRTVNGIEDQRKRTMEKH